MKSRELVLSTLEMNCPERIPRHLWLLPWAEMHHGEELKRIQNDFPDDIVMADGKVKNPPKTVGDAYKVGQYIDEWGCKFENKQAGIIGEVKEPLIKNLDDLSVVRPPIELLEIDKGAVNSFCRESDKFVLPGFCARPFEQLQFLRGTENVMMDLVLNPEGVGRVLRILHEFYLDAMTVWAETDVDGLFFMDDWGSQRSLLISPTMWRDVFKPMYADYIKLAHDHGKKIFMHSDGYIMEIFGDLVELGLDAINSQIFCMSVEELGKRYKGQITFWGEIDRQHLLPYGTVEDMHRAVELVYDSLYSDGGVIAQLEFTIGAKPENVRAVFERWSRYQDSCRQ